MRASPKVSLRAKKTQISLMTCVLYKKLFLRKLGFGIMILAASVFAVSTIARLERHIVLWAHLGATNSFFV